MRLTVNLPQKAVKAIEDNANWAGPADVKVEPTAGTFAPDILAVSCPTKAAKARTRKDAKSSRQATLYTPGPSERLVVDAWNDSEFIREHAAGEARNNVLPRAEVHKHLAKLRKAIKDVGLEPLMNLMADYFDCCLAREHLWDGKNHGYSHLGGFVSAVLRWHQDRRKALWWMRRKAGPVQDDNAELTKRLADAYAERFLGRKEFGLVNPSAEYGRFAAGAAGLAEFRKSNSWPEDKAVGHLLDALADSWGLGGCPPPGALASDRTWRVVFPAFIKALYG